jgi:hypothetical protein
VGPSIKDWWSLLVEGWSPHREALAYLTLLTVWELWNERNASFFYNKHAPSFIILLENNKREARLWVLACAECLGDLLLGKWACNILHLYFLVN